MSKDYSSIIRSSGLKLTRIAEKMGMSESHLRYYLAQERMDSKVEKRFLSATKEMLKSVEQALKKTSKMKAEKLSSETQTA